MRAGIRLTWLVSAVLVVGACTSSVEPSESEAPSAAPSASFAPAGNLPPGCEPIDLRGPAGERVDLNGIWSEGGSTAQPMTWWIRTEGNCIWGAGQVEDVAPPGSVSAAVHQVQSLSGLIGADLAITGEIILLGSLSVGAPGDPPRYSPLRMEIKVDETGNITLHEDRQPGVTGPRCPAPGGYCPAPLVLHRVD
jgi:hypothetical protein